MNENCAVIIDRATGRVESVGATDEVATLVQRNPAASWSLVGGSHFEIGDVPVKVSAILPAIVPTK